MINSAYSAGKLRRLHQDITRKRRGKLTRGVLLLQANAPTHTSRVARTGVTECGFEIIPHRELFDHPTNVTVAFPGKAHLYSRENY